MLPCIGVFRFAPDDGGEFAQLNFIPVGLRPEGENLRSGRISAARFLQFHRDFQHLPVVTLNGAEFEGAVGAADAQTASSVERVPAA